jgi:RNA polymerase-interacting CarD/CdnL/TRCF family regulator
LPGTKLVELEDIEEGSRILIPLDRVPKLGLRPAGAALEVIREELASEFEAPMETDEERQNLVEELINEGSPRGLAKALKRLHLIRQTSGLSREEEQTRRKIRGWLAAEVALAKDCTRAEAQALITRVLQETMAAHRRKEKEEAKERRRIAKAEKQAAEEQASSDNSTQ